MLFGWRRPWPLPPLRHDQPTLFCCWQHCSMLRRCTEAPSVKRSTCCRPWLRPGYPIRRAFRDNRLIEERARTAAYSQYLGIISLIRTDFEQMSRLLLDMVEEKRNLKTQDPPIQRIILYIDDLDRCRPERVVQVLEAVHLLLAFPLFIVVVGVDPRWLRHSLAYYHPQTLSDNGQRLVLDGNTGPAYYSTPQDYLEKIFQIPFALRSVEEEGYKHLVTHPLQPLPDPVQREPQSSAAAITATESSPAARVGRQNGERSLDNSVTPLPSTAEPQPTPVEQAAAPAEGEGTLGHTRREEPKHEAAAFTPLNPEQLDFKEWEEQDIYQLWPLFRTPRSIKRFINIYRLLRASLTTDLEVARFEGTKEQPGEYQQVLLLLAVVTAFPNEATRFMYRLKNWLETGSNQSDDNKIWHWKDALTAMRAELDRGTGHRAEVARDPGDDRQHRASVKTISSPMPQRNHSRDVDVDVAWERLIDRLSAVTSRGFTHPFSKGTAQQWAARVARYFFSIQSVESVSGHIRPVAMNDGV
jgi:KAP family P-loop domain